MRLLVLIPARGGSKGLPGKNLAEVGGIPLTGRAARLGSRVIERLGARGRVVCSTDDSAIAATARTWGAEVPFMRPMELATDGARSLDLIRHALEALGEEFDAVALLQPTSPLTEADDVLGALNLFHETGSPVVSVCRAEHPLEWHHRMDDTGRLIPVLPANDAYQRQKVEPTYRPNGAVYLASPAHLRDEGFWTSETRGFVMPPERSVDVDTAGDLAVARAYLAARPVPPIEIAGKKIGPGHPCFVIAEAGVNHNGSLDLALKLVDAAVGAGADAVKFQTFKAEKVIGRAAPKAEYQKARTAPDETQLEMVKRMELTVAEHKQVKLYCETRGILYLSSPFDEESLELLCEMGVPAIKIGSGELTNHAFLAKVGATNRPVLLSTGMATWEETDKAIKVLLDSGARSLALFHCVSSYPTPAEDCNLAVMGTMRQTFGVPTGWSDHTIGIAVAVAAAGLEADLVEKHLSLDKSLPGPDHSSSLDPAEFAELMRGVRAAEAAVGTGVKMRQPSECNTADVARRSIHTASDLVEGHCIRREDLILLRPGTGIPPERVEELLGKRTCRPLAGGAMLNWEDIA